MQPLIAITAGEVINKGYAWTPVVYGQFHTYTDAVVRAGGIPIIVPIIDNELMLRKLYDQCDGLLMAGGNDLDPVVYRADKSSLTRSLSPRRDKQETQLFKWAVADDKPVLGICRGLQVMNVALGGSLHQDIKANVQNSHNHEASADHKNFHHIAHKLKLQPGSRLARILGTTTIPANTLHHQAIDRLGKDLVVAARAEDDIIEAIELPAKRFVIGVQSHPEALEAKTEQQWRKLFAEFVNSAKQ
jgi:putative glutamine amidotransferase